MQNFSLVLLEKPIDSGLEKSEIIKMLDMFSEEDELVPIEIEGDQQSVAMGFITMAFAEKLDYNFPASGIYAFIANILNDMSNEREDNTYEYRGEKIFLTR